GAIELGDVAGGDAPDLIERTADHETRLDGAGAVGIKGEDPVEFQAVSVRGTRKHRLRRHSRDQVGGASAERFDVMAADRVKRRGLWAGSAVGIEGDGWGESAVHVKAERPG